MKIITDTLAGLAIGPAQAHLNLAIFPLTSEAAPEPGYLTLTEALKQNVARVQEVSEGGSVPELLLENNADKPVLLVDGEELVGAKQNRILNVTILVAPHTKTLIPVSCVEQGRWGYDRPDFGSEERVLYSRARAAKAMHVSASLHESNSRYSDQGEIWNDISAKARRMGTESASEAMADMYRQRAADVDGFTKAFTASERQAGAIFAIDGEAFGMELFDAPKTFAAFLPRLVRSYALDAIDTAQAVNDTPQRTNAIELLDGIGAATTERFPAVGGGEDVRITSPAFVGGALVCDRRIVHLAAFLLQGVRGRHGSVGGDEEAHFARASARRRGMVH